MISTADVERVERMTAALETAIDECDDLILYARRQAWAEDHSRVWRDRITAMRTARAGLGRTLTTIHELFH